MALGLLARHPGRPALAVSSALKRETSPLQARQRPAHSSALRVAHAPAPVGSDGYTIDLGGKVEGGQPGSSGEGRQDRPLQRAETAAHKGYNLPFCRAAAAPAYYVGGPSRRRERGIHCIGLHFSPDRRAMKPGASRKRAHRASACLLPFIP